ncbi:PREDICTED: diphosphoinositol polyphosphate phosphohydrolase 3-beta-like [Poecilia mexicana]|uniref:diphosphoinositol polyphosphate phosphohydrolase 3-beta-like n=1 Tax=Poecilia mexicana TaxID=48701 RepID=UPI00072E0C43|nr:PREDICTED: diphosphoinositol polyphosphate phosphohydrolase 3-beta-like [Poecilia mexicana]
MKLKPNQTRTYDGEGFKKRAACLCFKNEREEEVLLVSSSRHPDQWIVPGGGMEPEEEPWGAAVREVFEEAGVKGKLGRLLGVFEVSCFYIRKTNDKIMQHFLDDKRILKSAFIYAINSAVIPKTYPYDVFISFFFFFFSPFSLPTYLCPLSPSAGRKREWFTVDEAIKVLQSHKPVHAEYLRRLQLSCSPTNGNSILPSPPPNDNYPHYGTTTSAPSTGAVLGSSCR